MGLFSLLILFCITGVLLNHTEWISGSSVDGSLEKNLPAHIQKALPQSSDEVFENPPLSEIQELLKQQYHLEKVSEISLDEDAGEIIFDYKLPAGYASAIVDVNQKVLFLEYRKGSTWAILSDLHKGRNSAAVWSWLIDLSAILMVLFSLVGMVILFQNNKYRTLGLMLAGLGTVTPFIIYWIWVPRIAGV